MHTIVEGFVAMNYLSSKEQFFIALIDCPASVSHCSPLFFLYPYKVFEQIDSVIIFFLNPNISANILNILWYKSVCCKFLHNLCPIHIRFIPLI